MAGAAGGRLDPTKIKVADLIITNVRDHPTEPFASIWFNDSDDLSVFLASTPTGLEGRFDTATVIWTSSDLSTATECAIEEWFAQHKPDGDDGNDRAADESAAAIRWYVFALS